MPSRFRIMTLTLFALLLLLAPGCATSETTSASTMPQATSEATPEATPDAPAAVTAAPAPAPIDLEQSYLVGPSAARTLSYRIDWQASTTPGDQTGLQFVSPQGDSLMVLDGSSYLSRYRREDGRRMWRVPVDESEVYGATLVPGLERVYLSGGGSVLVLDAVTGAPADRQHLKKVVNTEPILYGDFLVYGSRDGQLIWHAHDVAFQARAYQISRTIQLPPVLYDQYLVVIGSGLGSDGSVMVLTADSGSQMWSKQLLDAIVAKPTVGNGVVYVAGMDQYLYAFDLDTGRTAWSTLTSSRLTSSPTLIGDRLYQQVPGEGLICFDAYPASSPGGRVVWVSEHVTGVVLTQHNNQLLAWDAARRQLKIVASGSGAVIDTISLPQVHSLTASDISNGNLIAWSHDGRLLRLVPRN